MAFGRNYSDGRKLKHLKRHVNRSELMTSKITLRSAHKGEANEDEDMETYEREHDDCFYSSFFFVGEDLTNKWIISDKAVRCLVVPKDFLLQHNRNNIWSRQLRKITDSFPSDALIYNSLMQQVKWFRYKKECVNHSIRRRSISTTTLDHVPYYWRICVDVPECLVWGGLFCVNYNKINIPTADKCLSRKWKIVI